MASITIGNLDDGVKRRLRVRAAENGRSMEEEARDILRRTVGETLPPKDLGRAIHARFAPLGGVDLDLPERGPMRPPPISGELAAVIVVDTYVVSELMRLAPPTAVMAWFTEQDSASLYLTAVSEAELRAGAAILRQAVGATASPPRWTA